MKKGKEKDKMKLIKGNFWGFLIIGIIVICIGIGFLGSNGGSTWGTGWAPSINKQKKEEITAEKNQTIAEVEDITTQIENYENPNNQNTQQPENPNSGVPNKNLNYAKEKSSTSYSVSKEVKHIVYAPGTIKRLTIAVAVNKILTKPEKEELQNLVLSAAGVDYERGDVITVSGLQFEALEQDKKNQENLEKKVAKETLFNYLATKLGPSIVILILGLVTITLLKNLISKLPHYEVQQNILDEAEEEDLAFDPLDPDESIANKIERIKGLSDGAFAALDFYGEDDTQASYKDIEISKQEQSINTLNEAILADPEAAAKVLMSYIKE